MPMVKSVWVITVEAKQSAGNAMQEALVCLVQLNNSLTIASNW
jgi:hypothetical protein